MAEFNLKEALDSAVEVAKLTLRGDIDIAEDHQKFSAWLAALAFAALYFTFREIALIENASTDCMSRNIVISYLIVANLFSLSFLAAYQLRRAHLKFSGFARNLLVAHEMQKSELLQDSEAFTITQPEDKEAGSIFLWQLMYTGDLNTNYFNKKLNPVTFTTEKLEKNRKKLDFWAKFQRLATLWSFTLLILVKTIQVVLHELAI